MNTRDYLTKKLMYQSKNRGCKETDILLGDFADACLLDMSAQELTEYESILSQNDCDIVDWITKKESAPAHLRSRVMAKLTSFYSSKFSG
jgi:succinate dehydrogenase flavin-adding protein (antitoxin of CptAB toxin-antitoxin module)